MARSSKQGGGKVNLRRTYLQRLTKIFGVREALAERMASTQLRSSIRINALSPLSADEIIAKLKAFGAELEPIAWCPGAYHCTVTNAPWRNRSCFKTVMFTSKMPPA